ncbi:MAG: rod shape-determining protein MreB [Oscillospiraceae bacterium]|nr:rod shape-determining protein MreB [Oscillospiraceae bacterium]
MIFFSRDLGVDLGTSNVLIYQEGKGIVLREPSVVAVDKLTGKVLQVGSSARNMLGRTPGNVVAMRPLREGVISDYEMTEKMLAEFFRKIMRYAILKPRVIVSVPSGVSGVEERAVIQSAMEAGARRVYLIEEPLAAALGAHLDITGPDGHMIVDIGGGTTDIAVLTLNGVAFSSSIKTAGDTFDDLIVRYIRRKHGAVIGLNTAEEIKMNVGCVMERPENPEMQVRGRDLKSGLFKDVVVTSAELLEFMRRPAKIIADEVLAVLEQATPELVADISRNGIVLAGGGCQIWGMDRFLAERTEIRCTIADDPDSCVAYGCGKSLEWLSHMQEGTINIARKRLLKE